MKKKQTPVLDSITIALYAKRELLKQAGKARRSFDEEIVRRRNLERYLLIAECDSPPAAPPAIAEFLLTLLSKREHVDATVGDLNEIFERECKAFGPARARRLYWSRALRSLWPLIQRGGARAIKWGMIVSILKRFLG